MPSLRTRITLFVLAAFCAAALGLNLGPRPSDVEARMASPEYQQQKAEHLARLHHLEAAH